MAFIGDREGVEYTVGTEDNNVPSNPDLDIAVYKKELDDELRNSMEEAPEMEDEELDEQPSADILGGLMSRRV
jgi:hypothetical protein